MIKKKLLVLVRMRTSIAKHNIAITSNKCVSDEPQDAVRNVKNSVNLPSGDLVEQKAEENKMSQQDTVLKYK